MVSLSEDVQYPSIQKSNYHSILKASGFGAYGEATIGVTIPVHGFLFSIETGYRYLNSPRLTASVNGTDDQGLSNLTQFLHNEIDYSTKYIDSVNQSGLVFLGSIGIEL